MIRRRESVLAVGRNGIPSYEIIPALPRWIVQNHAMPFRILPTQKKMGREFGVVWRRFPKSYDRGHERLHAPPTRPRWVLRDDSGSGRCAHRDRLLSSAWPLVPGSGRYPNHRFPGWSGRSSVRVISERVTAVDAQGYFVGRMPFRPTPISVRSGRVSPPRHARRGTLSPRVSICFPYCSGVAIHNRSRNMPEREILNRIQAFLAAPAWLAA